MKFLVLFLASAALASASYIGTKNVDVKQDGTIVIRGENGKQIEITKQNGPYGKKNIEIEVTGPNTVAKKILINDDNQVQVEGGVEYQIPENYGDEYRYKRASFVEGQDVIYDILNQYQGAVDEQTYQQLLNQVQNAVYKGQVSKYVLYALQALNENSRWNALVSGQTPYGQDYYKNFYGQGIYGQGIYGQGFYGKSKYAQLLNKFFQQKYGQGIYGQGVYGQQGFYGQQGVYGQQGFYGQDIYGQGIYGQNIQQQLLVNILVKLFNRQVLANILNEQGVYQQGIYGQQYFFNQIFANQEIFDKEGLLELINSPVLRTILVESGIFNETVLEKLLYIFTTQGVYDDALLQQLVNKQALQYYLTKQGFFNKYTLEQIVNQKVFGNTVYNKGIFGQEYLVQLAYNPVFRNYLIQQGIFNQYVLKQFLYVLNTQGVYSQNLLYKLVNKEALKNALVQQGIVDETTLEQLVENEVLGLNTLLTAEFVQQKYLPYYKQLYGGVNYQNLPYGEDFVDIDIKKTIIRPTYQGKAAEYFNNKYGQTTKNGLLNYLFYGNNYYNTNKYDYLRNIIYGQQGYNGGYTQGYPYTFQGRQGIYNQVPVYEQQYNYNY